MVTIFQATKIIVFSAILFPIASIMEVPTFSPIPVNLSTVNPTASNEIIPVSKGAALKLSSQTSAIAVPKSNVNCNALLIISFQSIPFKKLPKFSPIFFQSTEVIALDKKFEELFYF